MVSKYPDFLKKRNKITNPPGAFLIFQLISVIRIETNKWKPVISESHFKKKRIAAITSNGWMIGIPVKKKMSSINILFLWTQSLSTFLIKYICPFSFSELAENPQETGMHSIATSPFFCKDYEVDISEISNISVKK